MGAKHHIELERKIEGVDTVTNGAMLSRHLESLDKAARELGVRPLSDFFGMSLEEVAQYMDGGDALELPPVRDYSARDGLATVRALLGHKSIRTGQAIEDLRKCEQILSLAAERGVGWHFQADL